MADDSHETVENVASGVSITTKLKRGSGTRDQDTIKVKAKGKTGEGALENLDEVKGELEAWADEVRGIQAGSE